MSYLAALSWWAIVPFISFLEIFAAVGIFAGRAAKRSSFAVRCLLVLCLAWVMALITMKRAVDVGGVEAARSIAPDPIVPSVGEAILYANVLLIATGSTLWCFELTPWQAVFCSTAGYAMQNLASGITEAIALVAKAVGHGMPAHVHVLLSVPVCAAVFAIIYHVVIKRVHVEEIELPESRGLLGMMDVVIFAVIGFDVLLKEGVAAMVPLSTMLALRAFHALICFFTLVVEVEMLANRQLQVEKAATERLMAERERQYEMSRKTIDAINLKCHDLRHQIRHLADGGAAVDSAVLADMAREVNVYDSQVKTGNDALDTILTEKSLVCEREGITLTCIADGTALARIAPADLYALFGNALDNAIEAVRQVDAPDRRSISLVVRQRASMASIHVENWYDPDSSARVFVDGLPATTKDDAASHGFGTRSMRAIVERYGGTLTLSAGEETFSLDAMIPMED